MMKKKRTTWSRTPSSISSTIKSTTRGRTWWYAFARIHTHTHAYNTIRHAYMRIHLHPSTPLSASSQACKGKARKLDAIASALAKDRLVKAAHVDEAVDAYPWTPANPGEDLKNKLSKITWMLRAAPVLRQK